MSELDKQREDIFSRMTPDLVAGTLESIAASVRDERLNVTLELDIIHLRQIADWLSSQQRKEKQG